MRKEVDRRIDDIQGARLKVFLKEIGVSQSDLAEELGLQRSVVNRWVLGNVTIPAYAIVHLHRKYKMSYKWFFDGTGSKFDKAEDKKTLITDVSDMKVEITWLKEKLVAYTKMYEKLYHDFYEMKNRLNLQGHTGDTN